MTDKRDMLRRILRVWERSDKPLGHLIANALSQGALPTDIYFVDDVMLLRAIERWGN